MPAELTQQDILNLFLEYLQIPEPTVAEPSFLQIVRRSRDENMLSNILAYYAQSSHPHGFGCLLANSFIQLIAPQELQASHAEVYREYATGHGRLDLVIRTDFCTIGIEHKIDAALYNDLEDYRRTLINDFGEPLYCMVLSVEEKQTGHPDWCSVTYRQLWQRVRAQLGLYLNSSNLHHLPQLFSVIEHTEKLNMNTDLNDKERFLLAHYSQFRQLISSINELENKFLSKASNVYNLLEEEIRNDAVFASLIRCWYYLKKSPQGCLVFEFDSISCACDFGLSCAGVHFSFLHRGKGAVHFHALRQHLQSDIVDEVSNRYLFIGPEDNEYNNWFETDNYDSIRDKVRSVLSAICHYIRSAQLGV